MNAVTFLSAYGIYLMLWPLVPLSLLLLANAVKKLLNLPKKDFGDFVKNMGYAVTYGAVGMVFTGVYNAVKGAVAVAALGALAAIFVLALGLYLVAAGAVMAAAKD